MNARLQPTVGTVAATTTTTANPPPAIGIMADLFSEDVVALLRQNVRAARERMEKIEAYCESGRGGACTPTSRARLRREATRRVERAVIALSEVLPMIDRLRRAKRI